MSYDGGDDTPSYSYCRDELSTFSDLVGRRDLPVHLRLRDRVAHSAQAPGRRAAAPGVEARRGFTVRTFPASRTAGRAYSFPMVCLNESAFFRFEGAANADVEILTSVRRGMLNFPRRKLLIVSTPYAKQGILFDHYARFYGRDDSKDVLVSGTGGSKGQRMPVASRAF